MPNHTEPKVVLSHATLPWWMTTFPWWIPLHLTLRYWLIPFRDIEGKRILQSDCRRAFWFITWETEFSRICTFTKSCSTISTFISHQFQPNLMTLFYKKYKTPFFGRFCPLLVIFAQRGLFTHKPTWVTTTMLNFRKSECANSKRTSGQMEGRADPEPSSHSQRSKRKKRPFRSLLWPFLPKIYTNKPFQQKLIQNTLE